MPPASAPIAEYLRSSAFSDDGRERHYVRRLLLSRGGKPNASLCNVHRAMPPALPVFSRFVPRWRLASSGNSHDNEDGIEDSKRYV